MREKSVWSRDKIHIFSEISSQDIQENKDFVTRNKAVFTSLGVIA